MGYGKVPSNTSHESHEEFHEHSLHEGTNVMGFEVIYLTFDSESLVQFVGDHLPSVRDFRYRLPKRCASDHTT
jgi:hypothetical protein